MFHVIYSLFFGLGCGSILPGYHGVICMQRAKMNASPECGLFYVFFMICILLSSRSDNYTRYNYIGDMKLTFAITVFITIYKNFYQLLFLVILSYAEIKLRGFLLHYTVVISIDKLYWNCGVAIGLLMRTNLIGLSDAIVVLACVLPALIVQRRLTCTEMFKNGMLDFVPIYKKLGRKTVNILTDMKILTKIAVLYLTFLFVRISCYVPRKTAMLFFLVLQLRATPRRYYWLIAVANALAILHLLVRLDFITICSEITLGLCCSALINTLYEEFSKRDLFIGDAINSLTCLMFLLTYWIL